jgi:hypothetical protein
MEFLNGKGISRGEKGKRREEGRRRGRKEVKEKGQGEPRPGEGECQLHGFLSS